ncbi:MAG: hypothetical protein JW996_00140, partial [Candidatus Cloacimonetes bacterium]|nr:hypothetical protein [Candidatus Cloacimonadota bacterium]
MAELNISLSEVINLIVASDSIPKGICNIEPLGESFSFEFKTGLFFPKFVKIHVNLIEFEKGIFVLELITDWFADKVMKLLPFRDNEFIEYDFPRLIINLQHLLAEKINGLQIEQIEYQNSKFKILFNC